jgi:hypothetical protein
MMKIILKDGLSIAAAIVMATCSAASWAVSSGPQWLEAHTFDEQTGKPLADVAICLGTSARADQFGARRTDRNGVVRFENVRTVPLVLTASRSGYKGREQSLEPLYQSRVLVLKLVTGGGGPVCNAEQSAEDVDVTAGLAINTVNVRRDINVENGVLVSVVASGKINQIRLSEQADLDGVAWQPYKSAMPYTLSAGAGTRHLFVQVRRASEVEGASIAIESPVKQVNYNVP